VFWRKKRLEKQVLAHVDEAWKKFPESRQTLDRFTHVSNNLSDDFINEGRVAKIPSDALQTLICAKALKQDANNDVLDRTNSLLLCNAAGKVMLDLAATLTHKSQQKIFLNILTRFHESQKKLLDIAPLLIAGGGSKQSLGEAIGNLESCLRDCLKVTHSKSEKILNNLDEKQKILESLKKKGWLSTHPSNWRSLKSS
jgi:hypothetical protein